MERKAFSLLELLLVIALFALLGLIALPRIARARAAAEVAAARRAFAAAHALARQVAAQYGGLSRLHLEPVSGRVWVTVDTSAVPGITVLDTVGPVLDIDGSFASVRVEGRPRTLCFDPRGLGTARGNCDLPNATLVFRLGGLADTLTISRLGRLIKR